MLINPTNAAALYAGRSDNSQSATGSSSSEVKSQGNQQESGRTSDIGPAVVTKLSAAALESTRPVKEPSQSADTNRASEPAAEQSRDAGPEKRPERTENNRESSVNVMV